ncbi:MAG: thermosome subunit beta [Promethearchaeota archaeon]
MTFQGQPIIILKEGTERTRGKDATRNNIMAARLVADAIRSTLGPRGMDKLLVDTLGDVVISNDGRTILDEIDVQHPAAKMVVQVAKTQDQDAGDGTTTAVILAGELLRRAEVLLDKKIHATVIVNGYKEAADKAREYLKEMAKEIDITDEKVLMNIARTALNSKGVGSAKELLSEIAVKSALLILEEGKVDIDLVSILQKQGKGIEDTEFVEGVILDKEVVHARMPKKVDDVKITLLNVALEIKKTEYDAKIRISDATKMDAFKEEEGRMIKGLVDKILATGANVVACQKGIDDLAQYHMAKEGILAVRRVKKSDMEKLAKATGARIVNSLEDLSKNDLGSAGLVRETKIGDDKLVYVEKCASPKAVSVVLRGANKYITDEAERALHDALCVVRNAIEDGYVIAGGGAPEVMLARRLREYSTSLSGRKQLAVEAFADSLDLVPKTLAENAGMDAIDILAQLKEAHSKGKLYGLNLLDDNITDTFKAGVIEPLRIKEQAVRSASEAARLILRIDDVIAAKKLAGEGPPGGMPPGGMGGMGGMPPGMGGMPGMM